MHLSVCLASSRGSPCWTSSKRHGGLRAARLRNALSESGATGVAFEEGVYVRQGGDEQIMSLDESLYRNTLLLTSKALTNMATKSTAYGLQAIGKVEKHHG